MLRPTYAVPRRATMIDSGAMLEDAEEGGWMYASLPRRPNSTPQKLSSTLGFFHEQSRFKRHFVRFSIRGGSSNAYIHETDDPDEPPVVVFDLGTIVNVTKLSIPRAEALSFVTTSDDGADEHLECIHGQVVLGLDMGPGALLKLAFAQTDDRDAWFRWFSELVVHRELSEIDAGAAQDARNVFDASASQPVQVSAFASSLDGKHSIRDYTRRFLQSAVKASRSDEIPNNGKINVLPTGFQDYIPCLISANIKTGILQLASRRTSFFGPKMPKQLVLGDESKIVATLPWTTDFAVYVGETEAWSFQAKNREQRNAWVNYFRTVKGRGTLSQTDQQTFPYLNSAEEMANEAEKMSLAVAHSLKHGVAKPSRESDSDSSQSDVDVGGAFHVADVDKNRSPQQSVLTFDRALESFPHLAWTTLDDLDSPRSVTSDRPRSVRPFTPFVSHLDSVVLAYVDATCEPHLLGRRNFHLPPFAGSLAAKSLDARKANSPVRGSKVRHSPLRRNASPKKNSSRSASPTRRSETAAVVRAAQTTRSLQLGLSRLRVAAEDKERLRPRAVKLRTHEQDTGAASTPRRTQQPHLLSSDAIRIPRCLFSNVAPHIALSSHLGASTRR